MCHPGMYYNQKKPKTKQFTESQTKKLYKVYRTFCQNDQDIKKEARVQLSDKIQIILKEKRAYIVHRAILDIEGHITERKVRSLKAQNEIKLEKKYLWVMKQKMLVTS